MTVCPLLPRQQRVIEVLANERNAVLVVNDPVTVAKLRFVLHAHPALRHEPVDIAVVIFYPHRHIVDNTGVDFPAAGFIHSPSRQFERFVVVRRVERCLRVPGTRRRFHPMRVIEVYPQLIDGVLRNQFQLFCGVVPRHLMLFQQRKQF